MIDMNNEIKTLRKVTFDFVRGVAYLVTWLLKGQRERESELL